MDITRRIYFSVPKTTWREGKQAALAENQLDLVRGLADRVRDQGYMVEAFIRAEITESPSAYMGWSMGNVERVMRACSGAVIIGIPRWIFPTAYGEKRLATDFCAYEGALALTLGLPRLMLAEEKLARRVIFSEQYGDQIILFPEEEDSTWLDTFDFQSAFAGWLKKLEQRRDVFLGYCSASTELAQKVKNHLEDALGVTVLDWADFKPAGPILARIESAAKLCSGAILLFTKDDELAEEGGGYAPRDNVVFEAGYFSAAKGKERVLIIRQSGSKMPADLQGDIYGELADPSDIGPIEHILQKFVEECLYQYELG